MNSPRFISFPVPAERVRALAHGTLYRVPGVVPTGVLYFARVVRWMP